MTYIVSTDPSGGDEMWIYGLESPHGGAPTLFGPARYRDPLVDEMIVQDVAYADGALYVAAGSMLADGDGVNISGVSGGEIYVRRLPVTATTVKNRENIDPYGAGLWTLSSPGEVLDIPGIDVNDRGDVIVGYRAYDPNGKNVSTARYQLLYAGDYAFRKPELTLAPDPDWTGRGRDGLDYQTAVRDGVDPTAFWLGLRSFNDDKDGNPYDRMVLTYVRP